MVNSLTNKILHSIFTISCYYSGDNDNPIVTQFSSALRKLLIQNEIKSSDLSNCADNLKILMVTSRRQNQRNENNLLTFNVVREEEEEGEEEEPRPMIDINENDMLLDCCEEITISHMAGLLENKILQCGRFDCSCSEVLIQNEKVIDLSVSNKHRLPCISTLYICKVASACFNKSRNQINFDYDFVIENIMENIDLDCIFVDFFKCDISHKAGFVKYIVQEFIRLQATYIAKNLTLVEKKVLCRNKLNKIIHFLGC